MKMQLRKAQGEEGKILVKSLEMEDPTFESGTPHVATATFQNPKTASFDYTAELYLGKALGTKTVTSGPKTFTIAANGTLPVAFSVNMPTLTIPSDTYHVYLEVKQAGVVLITFVATDDVIVTVTPGINVTTITWT
jgi:hypothetical protein